MQDTSVSFGYQLDVPKANLLFKGTMCIHSVSGETFITTVIILHKQLYKNVLPVKYVCYRYKRKMKKIVTC